MKRLKSISKRKYKKKVGKFENEIDIIQDWFNYKLATPLSQVRSFVCLQEKGEDFLAHNSKRGNRPVVFFLESLTCKVYTRGQSVLGPTCQIG